MTTATDLYRLDEATVTNAYVDAIFGELKGFLLRKGQGHCQRVDFLPRRVITRLAQCLAEDTDLKAQRIVCRMVTDKPESEKPEAWEVTGSGAVALREDATYSRIKVFCALFPAGIRLAEEDSLNVSTFKTDDAESFDNEKCLLRYLRGKVNELPSDGAKVGSDYEGHGHLLAPDRPGAGWEELRASRRVAGSGTQGDTRTGRAHGQAVDMA